MAPVAARLALPSWLAWGLAALVAGASALLLAVVLSGLSADRAEAALLPEPVPEVVSGVTGSVTTPWSTTTPALPAVTPTPAPVVDPVAQTVTPIVDPVAQNLAPVVDPVVQTVDRVVDPVVQTVDRVVDPVVQSVDRVVDPVVQTVDQVVGPVVEPVLDPSTPLGALVMPVVDPVVVPLSSEVTTVSPQLAQQPSAPVPVTGRGGPPPSDPPPGIPLGVNAPDGVVADGAGRTTPPLWSPIASSSHPAAPSPPARPTPPPRPMPPARSAPSSSVDTTRVFELLLYAVAATLAALALSRGRRVLPFGAVEPRLAFVSSIERPG